VWNLQVAAEDSRVYEARSAIRRTLPKPNFIPQSSQISGRSLCGVYTVPSESPPGHSFEAARYDIIEVKKAPSQEPATRFFFFVLFFCSIVIVTGLSPEGSLKPPGPTHRDKTRTDRPKSFLSRHRAEAGRRAWPPTVDRHRPIRRPRRQDQQCAINIGTRGRDRRARVIVALDPPGQRLDRPAASSARRADTLTYDGCPGSAHMRRAIVQTRVRRFPGAVDHGSVRPNSRSARPRTSPSG